MSEYQRIAEYILSDGRVLLAFFGLMVVLVMSIVVMLRSYTTTQSTNNKTTQQFMAFITAQTKALGEHLEAVKAVQSEINGLRKEVPTAGAEIKQAIADWQSVGSIELNRVGDNLASKIAHIVAGLDGLKIGIEQIHLANGVQERALQQITAAVNASRDALLDAIRERTRADETKPTRELLFETTESTTVAGVVPNAPVVAIASAPTQSALQADSQNTTPLNLQTDSQDKQEGKQQ